MKPRPTTALDRIRHFRGWPLIALLVSGVALGLSLGNDYGLTYDEQLNAENGAAALRVYQGEDDYFDLPALPDHGPFYFMVMTLGSRLVHDLAPGWSLADGRHLTHFLMFLGATACFYFLCLRLSGRTAAWMASVLFLTQPLLLGHGFINQKDTPFMALFLATFVTGILAGDRLSNTFPRSQRGEPEPHPSGIRALSEQIAAQWRARRPAARLLYFAIVVSLLLLVIDLLGFGMLGRMGESLLTSAYHGDAPVPIQALFDLLASDAHKTPLEYYQGQFHSHYLGLRLPLAAASLLSLILASCAHFPVLKDLSGLSWAALASPALWASALLLGATVSVRQQGLFVGALVSLCLLHRARSRALMALLLFWVLAALVVYATWPYLWAAPVEKFSESLFWAAQFPSYDVFFEGRWVTSDTRPWYYLPKLVALQLTEPAVILALGGMALAALRARVDSTNRFLLLLLALWIGVPAFGVIFLRMTVYGNIRHLLFTLPAILSFTAVAFDWLLLRALPSRGRWLAWGAFALAIVPGLTALIYLHPHEYIYLNSLTGGVSGGYGRFELDHECISLRQGMQAANRLLPPGSVLKVPRQEPDIRQFARSDIRLAGNEVQVDSVDFVLTCTWPNPVEPGIPGFRPLYAVQYGNAVLATLWHRQLATP